MMPARARNSLLRLPSAASRAMSTAPAANDGPAFYEDLWWFEGSRPHFHQSIWRRGRLMWYFFFIVATLRGGTALSQLSQPILT